MTELKNSVESFNNIFGQAEERVSEVEQRLFEIIQLEEQKEKKEMKVSEESLRDLYNTIK